MARRRPRPSHRVQVETRGGPWRIVGWVFLGAIIAIGGMAALLILGLLGLAAGG